MNARVRFDDTEECVSVREELHVGCGKCGTELNHGAEFCHICGRWVFGSNFSRLWIKLRSLMGNSVDIPVFICMLAAAIFVVISIFVDIRMNPQTIGEWQVIQFWRIEWLLGAMVALLCGLLLKKTR